MKNHDWGQKEYESIRLEIIERAKMLHQLISMAVILSGVFLIAGMWLLSHSPSFVTFLLCIPIIFAGLTFNYQANQMTLEALAGYLGHSLHPAIKQALNFDVFGWDAYYGKHKFSYRLTSFLKVLPLLIPMLIPFIVLFMNDGTLAQGYHRILIGVDIFLFLLIIFNFRYKWST